MTDNVTNDLLLEQLKAIRAEQAAARERDDEMLRRLGTVETIMARVSRDMGEFVAEQVGDRHSMDKLRARLERIERRLELNEPN